MADCRQTRKVLNIFKLNELTIGYAYMLKIACVQIVLEQRFPTCSTRIPGVREIPLRVTQKMYISNGETP